jgi:hypothetical protein
MKATAPVHGTTIGEQWASYLAEVVPADAPDVQREECKRAFYSGASAMLTCVFAATDHAEEDMCQAAIGALERELLDYIRLFGKREGV